MGRDSRNKGTVKVRVEHFTKFSLYPGKRKSRADINGVARRAPPKTKRKSRADTEQSEEIKSSHSGSHRSDLRLPDSQEPSIHDRHRKPNQYLATRASLEKL